MRSVWAWDVVKTIVGLSILLFAILLLVFGFTEDGVRAVIASSAKISFFCFCIAFATSAIHYLKKNVFTFWLRQNRKYIGISFAIIHFIHLFFLVLLQLYFHPVFELAASFSLFAGGTAYFFIALMFLTSFDIFSKPLSGLQWKWLHTIGGYWIFAIFFSSYLKRSLRIGELWHWAFVGILIAILILRLWKIIDTKKII